MTAYPLLERINSPADLRRLDRSRLQPLAQELRAYLLETVSQTGGHLSSNLGTVELSIALHRVFETPRDRIVWDVGHQSYPHKILTGRRDAMPTLRQLGGLSGFPRRVESEYDTFGTAHSSTSISAALGMAVASRNLGDNVGPRRRRHIAVIGDGALSAGMAFEALNNAGVTPDIDLLVILNDNDMSISPAVGALNRYLARLLSGRFYAAARSFARDVLSIAPPVLEIARRFEEHAKGMVSPATLFEEFGFNYVGPIDGHDLESLVPTLQNLRELRGPQFLHVVTRKGRATSVPKPIRLPTTVPESLTRQSAWANPVRRPNQRLPRFSGSGCVTRPKPTPAWSRSRRRCGKARAWLNSSVGFHRVILTSASPSSTP